MLIRLLFLELSLCLAYIPRAQAEVCDAILGTPEPSLSIESISGLSDSEYLDNIVKAIKDAKKSKMYIVAATRGYSRWRGDPWIAPTTNGLVGQVKDYRETHDKYYPYAHHFEFLLAEPPGHAPASPNVQLKVWRKINLEVGRAPSPANKFFYVQPEAVIRPGIFKSYFQWRLKQYADSNKYIFMVRSNYGKESFLYDFGLGYVRSDEITEDDITIRSIWDPNQDSRSRFSSSNLEILVFKILKKFE